MKCKIERSALASLLSLASVGLSTKPQTAILGDLLIDVDASQQKFKVTAFDLSIGIQVIGDCSVEQGGTIAVPGRLLINMVSEVADGVLCLKANDKRVEIVHPQGKCSLQRIDHSEFPDLPKPKGERISFGISEFLKALRATVGSADKGGSRQILDGVHITIGDELWDAAATDGHRMSLVSTPIGESAGKQQGIEITIPRTSVTEIDKILSRCDSEGSIELEIDDGVAAFECEADIAQVRFSTRLWGGQYPNIRAVIPQESLYRFEVGRRELSQSVKRCGLLWDSGIRMVSLRFEKPSQVVQISTSSDTGESNEEIPIVWGAGSDTFEIHFNGELLQQCLKQLGTDKIAIECIAKDRPAIMRPIGSDIDHLVLLMPLAKLGS